MSEIIDIQSRLTGPTRRHVIGDDPQPTVLDDLRDLAADIFAEPSSHLVAAMLGLTTGCFATLGLAWVWSWFL